MSEYKTRDMWLAATMQVEGVPLVGIEVERNGQATFLLDAGETDVKQYENDYYDGNITVSPPDLRAKIRDLASRVQRKMRGDNDDRKFKKGWEFHDSAKDPLPPKKKSGPQYIVGVDIAEKKGEKSMMVVAEKKGDVTHVIDVQDIGDGKPLAGCALALAKVIASRHPLKLTKAQISTLSGYSPRSSTFQNGLSTLRTGGWASDETGLFEPTIKLFAVLGGVPEPMSQEETIALWRKSLGEGVTRRVFEVLLDQRRLVDKSLLAQMVGSTTTSSTFQNALSTLRSNGLAKNVGAGSVAITEDLL